MSRIESISPDGADIAVTTKLALQAKDLRFTYPGGLTAVTDGVTLQIAKGEIYCLLGANGTGKTTLIRQLTGELVSDAGQVWVKGVLTDGVKNDDHRSIGILPQSANLFEALTVRQHLICFAELKLKGRAQQKEAVLKNIECFALQPLLTKRAGTLSLGQKRLVLVALACLGDPELLVLDEPTVGMDPAARRVLWAVLRDAQKRGTAILLTTHYMDEAEQLSSRIGFLSGGRISHEGTIDNLRTLIDAQVRLTVRDAQTHRTITQQNFATPDAAMAYIRDKDLTFYAIEPLSLEDVYLALVGAAHDSATPLQEAAHGLR